MMIGFGGTGGGRSISISLRSVGAPDISNFCIGCLRELSVSTGFNDGVEFRLDDTLLLLFDVITDVMPGNVSRLDPTAQMVIGRLRFAGVVGKCSSSG